MAERKYHILEVLEEWADALYLPKAWVSSEILLVQVSETRAEYQLPWKVDGETYVFVLNENDRLVVPETFLSDWGEAWELKDYYPEGD